MNKLVLNKSRSNAAKDKQERAGQAFLGSDLLTQFISNSLYASICLAYITEDTFNCINLKIGTSSVHVGRNNNTKIMKSLLKGSQLLVY